jgi:hypothetical protein
MGRKDKENGNEVNFEQQKQGPGFEKGKKKRGQIPGN